MAHSPAASAASRAPRVTVDTPSVVLADVISYGFALAVIVTAMLTEVEFRAWQAVTLLVLFVLLRAVAGEVRRDAERAALRDARRRAALRAQSPARWTVEQRDGLGRRVDRGA